MSAASFPDLSVKLGQTLREVDPELQGKVAELLDALLPVSPQAAYVFLESLRSVLERIQPDRLDVWFQEGVRLLRGSQEAGLAYFRLESVPSHEVLERLSRRVDLGEVGEILRHYGQALSGKNVQVLPITELTGRGIGGNAPQELEGNGIYLPPAVDWLTSKERNFTWYKVTATHQAGHLEFGSFDFRFERSAAVFSNLRPKLATVSKNATPLHGFFDLFVDRELAQEAFAIAEDTRVDSQLKGEYRGLAPALAQAQQEALSQRPSLETLPLREAFLEAMVRLSLGERRLRFPREAHPQIRRAFRILSRLRLAQARVEDTAEATIRLYALLTQFANEVVPEGEWEPVHFQEDADSEQNDGGEETPEGLVFNLTQEDLAEMVPEMEFRSDLEPDPVKASLSGKEQKGQLLKPAAEEPRELVRKDGQGSATFMSPDQLKTPPDQFVSNLPKVDYPKVSFLSKADRGEPLPRVEGSFLYDEWDFWAGAYLPRWCRVRPRPLEEGSIEFFERTLKSYYGLTAQVRKEFELIPPESLHKVRRLSDGEDLELDAVIEAFVERRAGQAPSEKVYWRRQRAKRDVAMVFLLDMSASTGEAIDEQRSWHQRRRIIDVEKEGTVVLVRALEILGDTYGIYGFSGYGRENVDFYVIKDIDEPFSVRVKRRVDKIAPVHATRMGPAIRHAVSRLERQPARTKILFLLSDGRPHDYDYGRDGPEKEYAIHDTKMALIEARRRRIVPFCLTVDREGHDYLRIMCQDMGYEVLSEISSLPSRLLALYSTLTS